ncbi:DUF6230 family protein [Streptomyces sp. NPDC085931]|uniref:DUF6230 family protein n=1 Tax=Streptomyces sp. NPDC085931 TaxID=3365740 RepID=UPI0037D4F56D
MSTHHDAVGVSTLPPGTGRRRWRRFWLLLAPSALATTAVLALVAQGAVAASASASGRAFKVSGDRLSGRGFAALPGVNTEPGGAMHPVVVVSAQQAELRNLCVSVLVPTPLGEITLRVKAGTDEPVRATGLVVHSDQLSGDIRFGDVLAQATGPHRDNPGGMEASTDRVVVIGPKFTGWRGTAGSFHLKDMSMRLLPGEHECF